MLFNNRYFVNGYSSFIIFKIFSRLAFKLGATKIIKKQKLFYKKYF